MAMRLQVWRAGAVVLALAVAGCGGSESEEPEQRDSVFDPMVQTMDRARQVEELNKERKAALDAALERSEGDEQDERAP